MPQESEYGAAQSFLGPVMDLKRKARNLYDRLNQPIAPRYTPYFDDQVRAANRSFQTAAAAEDAKKAAVKKAVPRTSPKRTPPRTPPRPAATRR
jgi:hypothetical protein